MYIPVIKKLLRAKFEYKKSKYKIEKVSMMGNKFRNNYEMKVN